MNQTSDKFFDEMLKDNMPADTAGSFQDQLADMIDKRISESMRKFEEQFSQISQPAAADPADAAKEAAAEIPAEAPAEPPAGESSDN